MADIVADINDGPLTKKVLALEKLAGDAAQLAAHAGVVAAQLAHSSPMVRQSALDALLRLPPAELTAHADALVGRLADDEGRGRELALRALKRCDTHSPPVVDAIAARMLEDHDGAVASVAREVLESLSPEELGPVHAARLSKEQYGLKYGLFFKAAVRFAFVAALAWYYTQM